MQTDEQKSYYKYYDAPLAPPPPEKMKKIAGGPISPGKAIPFKDRNRLLAEAKFDEEDGYCIMPDGTGYVAAHVMIPGATIELVDWWFAWHTLDSLSYKLWNKESHLNAQSLQSGKLRDDMLTLKEKYWDSTCMVERKVTVGMGLPETRYLNYKRPRDLGFDESLIGPDATLVCLRETGKGFPPYASPDTLVCYHAKNVDGGVELRMRAWLGWTYAEGEDVKAFPNKFRMIPMMALTSCMYHTKSLANLAAFLPKLYVEEKDSF